MNLFFTYVVNWFKQILLWVYSNILSLQVGGVPIYGWMLGLVIVIMLFGWLIRVRADRYFGYKSARGAKASVDSAVRSGSVSYIPANGKGGYSYSPRSSATTSNPSRVSYGRYHNAHRGQEGW